MKNFIIGIISITIILILSGYVILFPKQIEKTSDINYIVNDKCGIYSEGRVKINDKIINVLVSDNDCKRELGLSGVKTLKYSEGMIFVFDNIGFYPFWMNEMLFPIDILWISDDFKIVGVESNVQPNTYPKIFGEKYLAKYVLEISANFFKNNKIKVGDRINFTEK